MLRFNALALAAALMLPASSAFAQKTTQTGVGGGGSPHVTSTWTVGGATITISYGRPSLKGRPEATMMPAGKPWRLGADEATVITSTKPLTFGSVKLEANKSYTLNVQPADADWQLLIGKLDKPGQWGIPYQANLELGRVPMKLGKAATAAEQVTIAIDNTKTPALRIEWGTKSATVPFTVGQ